MHPYTRCAREKVGFENFVGYEHSIFFFMLVNMSQAKLRRVLICLTISCYRRKGIKESAWNFYVKNEVKCSNSFRILTVTFDEFAVNKWVQDPPAIEQPMKRLKEWRKLLWRFVASLLEKLFRIPVYQLDHAMQFFLVGKCLLGMKRHGYCIAIVYQLTHHCLFVIAWPKMRPESCFSRDMASCEFSYSQNWKHPWTEGL